MNSVNLVGKIYSKEALTKNLDGDAMMEFVLLTNESVCDPCKKETKNDYICDLVRCIAVGGKALYINNRLETGQRVSIEGRCACHVKNINGKEKADDMVVFVSGMERLGTVKKIWHFDNNGDEDYTYDI